MNEEYERKDLLDEEQDTVYLGNSGEYRTEYTGNNSDYPEGDSEIPNYNTQQGTYKESSDYQREEYVNEPNRYQENFDQGYYPEHERKVEKPKSKGGMRTVALALIFSLIGSLVGGAFGAMLVQRKYQGEVTSEVTGKTTSYTINTDDSINTVAAVAEATLDSVVGISTTSIMRDFFNRQYEAQGTGSGVIVDSRGYILTNNHVISSLSQGNYYGGNQSSGYANDIQVVFNDSSQLPAEVIWADSEMDLAILKVEATKALPAAKLGDSDALRIGEMAIAIGNPFAIEFHGTVTAGYISGLNRNLSAEGGSEMDNLIQTDASINQGNSGGPLLNSQGEVIGINTMKITAGEGMGFSIPINTAKPIIEQVIETGDFDRVALGVTGVDIEKFEAQNGVDIGVDQGIIVINIYENSPAKVADLRTNDIITSVNGESVNTITALRRALTKYSIGDTVTVEYLRDGDTHTVDVTFKEFNVEQ